MCDARHRVPLIMAVKVLINNNKQHTGLHATKDRTNSHKRDRGHRCHECQRKSFRWNRQMPMGHCLSRYMRATLTFGSCKVIVIIVSSHHLHHTHPLEICGHRGITNRKGMPTKPTKLTEQKNELAEQIANTHRIDYCGYGTIGR